MTVPFSCRLLMTGAFVFCLILGKPVQGQDVRDYVEITLADGSEFVGTILSESETTVSFMTVSGIEMTFKTSDIVSRRNIRARYTEKGLKKLDPNSSRLFFSATGRPMNKGASYVSLHELFFASGAHGVSDRLVLAGGLSLIPGASAQLVYAAPKLTVYSENNKHVSVGVLLGGVTGEPDAGGIMYATATLGPEDRGLTVGTGFLFGNGDVSSTPVIMLGGEKQISRKTKLITENYFMPGISSNGVISLGMRILGDRLTTDVAALSHTALLDEGGFPFIPWLSFTYHFGH